MSSSNSAFQPGDRVRVADTAPSPTDPIGEVVAVVPDRPAVVVRWQTGRERSFHPSGLAPVDG